MSEKQHPFEDEDWVQEVGPDEYYVGRQRGNYLILLGILAFIAFTVGMTVLNFSTGKFQRETWCYEALKEGDAVAQQTYCDPERLLAESEEINASDS